MAILETGDLEIPTEVLDPWLGKIKHGSVVAALSNSIPMKFGKGQSMAFDIGEAEYVGEGQNKGPSAFTKTTMNTDPFKFHKTVRWTEEVMWADEDHQLGVVEQILALIQPALSRALDFGVIHAVNPLDGTPVAAMMQALKNATQTVDVTGTEKPYALLDAADALVLGNSYVPRDVALAPGLAGRFSSLRGEQTEQKMYPSFQLSTDVSELDGHRSSVSRTVPGLPTVEDSGIEGIVGDFDAVRWGIQKSLGLEVIRYGDPDGQGDLKRNNQVAFRAEVVYGWGIADLDAFALLKTGAAEGNG